MFALICKRSTLTSHFTDLHYYHVTSLHLLTKSFSSSSSLSDKKFVSKDGDEHSFTVSYLVNSCGLSSEKAVSVSKKVRFKTSIQPDSVLTLLKNNGFEDAHISKLVMKRPKLLLVNARTNLLPKLEFLRSIGISSFDIARITSSDPTLFHYSLTKSIIPNYNAIKSIVGSDESVVKAFNCYSRILQMNISTNVVSNLKILRELGTPESSITRMLTKFPRPTILTHERFKAIVDYLKALGCNPSKASFDRAIGTIYGIGKATVEHKFNIYARWGWSKKDAISAFECQPSCMSFSEKRIMSVMDFLVNKMGFSSQLIAKRPIILTYSLERRIVPRCLVAKVLLQNSLIKRDFKLAWLLDCNENDFLKKFVLKFQEQVPQLRDVYDRKVDIADLGINFKVDTIDRGIDFKD